MSTPGDFPTVDVPAALATALAERYRVDRLVGRGGMAAVYLARDRKHDRDVAIKVLPPDVIASVGPERFLAEIRTTGQLKHPHILPLFDSGSSDAVLFYVMPFIDGESLRPHIERTGILSIVDIVRILQQLADALAYAHTHGVIHRDVKPENVLVSGRDIFLADFGIARALATADSATQATAAGVMVGTPAYMAPEQAVGGSVDARTDIYAFGVLAYELLTGSPPFSGSPQAIITARLTRPPAPVTLRRPDAPQALDALVMKCLQRAPDERYQSMEEVAAVLERLVTPHSATSRAGSWRGSAVVAAAVLGMIAIGAAWYASLSVINPVTLTIGRLVRVTSDPGLELDPAIAPDGRTIAYAAGPPGRMRLYLRQLAGNRAIALLSDSFSDSQRWPQWSPDGSRLVFQAGQLPSESRSAPDSATLLYEAPALGGTARKLFASMPRRLAAGPSWSPDGDRIVFGGFDGLFVVPAQGDATPRLLVEDTEAHSPRWSPDGRAIAYVRGAGQFTFSEDSFGNTSNSALVLLTVTDGRAHVITKGNSLDTSPVWMPDGRTLLFISTRDGGRDVYAVPLSPTGQPEQEPRRLTSGSNAHTLSLARDGTLLAYSSYVPSANVWSVAIPPTDSVSVADARQVTFGNEKVEKLAISPDGKWLAYDSDRHGQADIWKMPLSGGAPEQVTRATTHEFVNDWSPDGHELVFHSMREDGQRDVFVIAADGTGTQAVTTSAAEEQHAGWGPDGNTILFDSSTRGSTNQAYIVTRPSRGAPWGTPRQLTRNGSSDPKWSPDGRLVAFCLRGQLRVIAPDGSGERVVVDAQSGAIPQPTYAIWSADSATIYYKAYDRDRHSSIWSVPAAGGTPRLLVRFDDPSRRSLRREFATDGQRFYFTIARDESDIWTAELQRK